MPPLPEGLGGYIALGAWRGDTTLNLKYMGPDGLVYSLADWQDELARDGAEGGGGKRSSSNSETKRSPSSSTPMAVSNR